MMVSLVFVKQLFEHAQFFLFPILINLYLFYRKCLRVWDDHHLHNNNNNYKKVENPYEENKSRWGKR